MAFLIGGANSAVSGYDINNSLRFEDGDSAYLRIDSGENASNRQIWTYSFWCKRSLITSAQYLLTSNDVGGSNHVRLFFAADDSLTLELRIGGTVTTLDTNRKFRDVSSWYHIVYAVDTTQGTAANRIKLYVNGTQESSFATEEYPAQNEDTEMMNDTEVMTIGSTTAGGSYYDGYLAEIALITLTAGLTASTFGETDEDSGIWKPKEITQSFSTTNSFYLEFKQSGTDQDASGLGADTGGNDKHFAVTNLTALDQMTDTPTNSFCTGNPLDIKGVLSVNAGYVAWTEGNTNVQQTSGADRVVGWKASTHGISNGKWYFEIKAPTVGHQVFGVGPDTWDGQDGAHANVFHVYINAGSAKYRYGPGTDESYTRTEATNDIYMFALDLDTPKHWFGYNGTWHASGDPAAGSNPNSTQAITETLFVAGSFYTDDEELHCNFGNPGVSISSGNADDNGYGNFEYDVPAGFYAICTKNLATYG